MTEARTFDLSSLAEAATKESRGRRFFVVYIGCLAAGMVVVGLVLLFATALRFGVAGKAPGAVLAVVGLLVLVKAWSIGSGLGAGPRRLVVTSGYLSLESAPHRSDLRLRWDSPNFKLTIYDGSGLSKTRRDGHVRAADYVAEVGRYPQIPLPREAYEAIIGEAKLHRLSLSRRPMGTREAGKLEVVVLQPA